MKKSSIASWFVTIALATSVSAPAHAETKLFPAFFNALQGQWEGKGVLHDLGTDGAMHDTRYDMELQSSPSGQDGVWNLNNSITTESGQTSQNSTYFSVQGDVLFVGSNSGPEPVLVIENSPRSLTYSFRRTDTWNGRTYEFTFETQLDPTGRYLTGHNVVQTNGVTIDDETFNATRW